MINKIIYENNLIAIIIKSNYSEEGIHFFTPSEFSQQLACMYHPKGKIIDAHIHNMVTRQVNYTQEVLIIKRGKLRVDFYSVKEKYIESYILEAGDIILLALGGHGFEVLEELEMIEIKQGPYAGENDKTKFKCVENESILIKGE